MGGRAATLSLILAIDDVSCAGVSTFMNGWMYIAAAGMNKMIESTACRRKELVASK